MAYEDVPRRLIDGEAVPRSEIIGYVGASTDIKTTLTLNVMCMMLVMVKVYEDETVKYQLTAFGLQLRLDFIVRLEGECPDCG